MYIPLGFLGNWLVYTTDDCQYRSSFTVVLPLNPTIIGYIGAYLFSHSRKNQIKGNVPDAETCMIDGVDTDEAQTRNFPGANRVFYQLNYWPI